MGASCRLKTWNESLQGGASRHKATTLLYCVISVLMRETYRDVNRTSCTGTWSQRNSEFASFIHYIYSSTFSSYALSACCPTCRFGLADKSSFRPCFCQIKGLYVSWSQKVIETIDLTYVFVINQLNQSANTSLFLLSVSFLSMILSFIIWGVGWAKTVWSASICGYKKVYIQQWLIKHTDKYFIRDEKEPGDHLFIYSVDYACRHSSESSDHHHNNNTTPQQWRDTRLWGVTWVRSSRCVQVHKSHRRPVIRGRVGDSA